MCSASCSDCPVLAPRLARDSAREMVLAAAAAVGEEEKASSEDVTALVSAPLDWACGSRRDASLASSFTDVLSECDGAMRSGSCVDSALSGRSTGTCNFGLFEGESNRKVSSSPLWEAGMGDKGALKLDSMSCRWLRTTNSACESECLFSRFVGLSIKLLSGGCAPEGARKGMFSSLVVVDGFGCVVVVDGSERAPGSSSRRESLTSLEASGSTTLAVEGRDPGLSDLVSSSIVNIVAG